ncbi:zinc finger protein 596 [Drosophila pseudoobscura]|uniref:Zinc finger protein 596 n=1 Tax=Drosophila pseudoobscura pseudoobscura TaxID=46245 RepID=A0A6I8UGH6_DROPS|nr:zinc finger protein 596 [Drosophila pseudoobscura]
MSGKPLKPKPPGGEPGGAQGVPPQKQTKDRLYHCGSCLASFRWYPKTKQHEQHCAGRLWRLHICKHCLTLFGDEKVLERHLARKHADGRFLCLQCGKRYSSTTFLYRHVVSWHGLHSLFYCAMCANSRNDVKTFSSMDALQAHAELAHDLAPRETHSEVGDTEELEMLEENIDDILPGVDWDDDVTFGWPMDLDKEACIADHKPSSYVCPICGNGFPGSMSLIRHLADTHQKSSLECCFCGKLHTTRGALRGHLERMHVLIRRHVCHICQADFTTVDHLKKHVQSSHIKDRPHLCPACGKGYNRLCDLNKHVCSTQEHGREPHICQLCNYAFRRIVDLKQHVIKKHA